MITELDKLFKTLRIGITFYIIIYILKILLIITFIIGFIYITIVANKVGNAVSETGSGGSIINLNTTHFKELCMNCEKIVNQTLKKECKLNYCY